MAEHILGPADSYLTDGEMKQVELDDETKLVVARQSGEYFGFGASCTHYGGPLAKGVLAGHTVMCPWHHACFDIRSGHRTQPPGLNDIARFDVRIDEDGQVVVSSEGVKPSYQMNSDGRVFVIVGGGAAAQTAAEELRRLGFGGSIKMISDSDLPPVDRPNFSKDYLKGDMPESWIPLRGKDWYKDKDIELMLNTRVEAVNAPEHSVTLDNGRSVKYDKLLLATGSVARMLPIPGADRENVTTLRTIHDADKIIAAAKAGGNIIIVGSSFIGMEVASMVGSAHEGVSLTVVGIEKVPFENVLGEQVGAMYRAWHEENGISFRMESKVSAITDEGVELENGEVLPADFVVMGVGVRPATEFLENGEILLAKDAGVIAEKTLVSNNPDVYAAGDIAFYDGIRIEHWVVAEIHGVVAATNMLGGNASVYDHTPYFWTSQWGKSLRYVGHAAEWDEVIIRGDVDERQFIAFYVKRGEMLAAAGLGMDKDMDALDFILRAKAAQAESLVEDLVEVGITRAQMKDESFDLVAYAQSLYVET